MPQRMMRKLVTATIAVGLIGGSAFGSPLAFADPEPAPDPFGPLPGPVPRRRGARGRGTYRPCRCDRTAAAGCRPTRSRRRLPRIRWPCRLRPLPVDPLAPPADPAAPPADPFASRPTTIPEGTPAGQNPTPYVGDPVFLPPSFNPVNGSMVGVGKPIIINFQRPIVDRPMAEQAIHISSTPAVPGKFYWMSDTQVRWRPLDLLAEGHQRPHRRKRRQVDASAPVSRSSPPSTTRHTR